MSHEIQTGPSTTFVSDVTPPYTVQYWGRVYRAAGPTFGLQSVISGLEYRDVCEHIIRASRRDSTIEVLDANGKRVSLGMFVMS